MSSRSNRPDLPFNLGKHFSKDRSDRTEDVRARTTARTSSIARSISWSYWWRRLVFWLVLDLVLCVAVVASFHWYAIRTVDGYNQTIGRIAQVVQQDLSATPDAGSSDEAGAASDGGTDENATAGGEGSGSSPDTVTDSNTGIRYRTENEWTTDYAYVLTLADGSERRFTLSAYITNFIPPAIALAVFQVLDLLAIFGDTRRVRRKLQPLNELALTAESIANYPLAQDARIEDLEHAIERASVESPQIATGNADLRSIEVALNSLLRQMQESRAQQMRFVSDASHELRTPIAVIQGYVNMLDRWGTSDEKVLQESIEALKMESEHMQELVEQLLFLARGDSGRTVLQRTQVNFAAMVREVWEESEMVDNTHSYRCPLTEQNAGDARFVASCDLALVKQSMRTIVQNAAKYSPAGTTITLSAQADDAGVAYVVQDEGIGMNGNDVSRAFERFYRADGARGTNEGSGLGLSIAKWIVDAHGGTIDVLTSEGVGTRFTVSFPRTA